MKLFIIISLAALSLASPVDKTDQLVPKTTIYDSKNPTFNPVPLNKAPLSPSTVDLHPLNKRDTQKPQSAPTAVNSQNSKPAVAPVVQKDAAKPVNTNRKTRDTAQKTAPTAVNSQNSKPAVAPVVQKDATKPVNTNRKTRDTAQKSATTASPSNVAQKAATQAPSPKRTRDVPKPEDVKKTPTVNTQKVSPSTNNGPQVARVPLTSTNSRSRRDAPKPEDKTKTTETNVKTDKTQSSDIPASSVAKPKKDSETETRPQTSNNQGVTGVRRPAPVDQILKHRSAATTEAPKAVVAQSA